MRKLLKLILTTPIILVLMSGQILAQENEQVAENIDEEDESFGVSDQMKGVYKS